MTTSCAPPVGIEKRFEKCRSPLRWAILALGCLMMVGLYYCCDTPAALKAQIGDYMDNPSDYEFRFGLLFTLYAAPNVVLPIFGGFFIDKLGTRWGLLTFASIIAIGQVLFSVGMVMKSWSIVFLGRFLFGLGGESYIVANTALLSDWFKGKELAFSFGVNLAVSKLGSVLNDVTSPVLASHSLALALWAGSLLCLLDVLLVLWANSLDQSAEQQLHEQPRYSHVADQDDFGASPSATDKVVELRAMHPAETPRAESASEIVADPFPPPRGRMGFPAVFWLLVLSCALVYGCVLPFNNISSALLLERDYFQPVPPGCRLREAAACQSAANAPVDCPAASSPTARGYRLPLPTNATVDGVRYAPLTAGDVNCLATAWRTGCTAAYCAREAEARLRAGRVMSVPYLVSAALSPPLGLFVDVCGGRAAIALAAPLLLVVVHGLLGFSACAAAGLLAGQGLAYAGFAAALWPSVPLVVREEDTGLAFGVVTSVQNLAAAVVPLAVAQTYAWGGGRYVPHVEGLFVALGAAGAAVGAYLNYHDRVHGGGVLNSPCLVHPS